MKTRSKSINMFIDRIQNEADRRGVKVTVTKSKNVSRSCQGIFIPPKRGYSAGGAIRVAAGGVTLAEFLLSLAHEFIHMRQYFNKESIYYSFSYYKLERNTEKRAISFMKRNGVPQYLVKEAERLSKRYLKEIAESESK